MIQFLKYGISSISLDLYGEILRLNKSHTNHTIQIPPRKTTLIHLEKNLYRKIYKREIFVKIFSNN